MPSLPPRRRDSALQFVCAEPCSLRLRPRSSTSRVVISRLPHVRFRYSLVTHNHPFDGLVGRLQSLGFPPPCYPSYGAPTFTPVGLPPTECASLSWTHGPAQRSLPLWPARSRSRLATLYTESSDRFVTSAVVSVATGWSEPVPGRELHPLKPSAFSRRTCNRDLSPTTARVARMSLRVWPATTGFAIGRGMLRPRLISTRNS